MAVITITPALVREVIKTILPDSDIEGLITAADALYYSVLSAEEPADAVQLEIKRWTAAHFVALKDHTSRVEESEIGDTMTKFGTIGGSQAAKGLYSTRWGQTAIMFDTSGKLRNLGKGHPKFVSL
jgi:hypothetical protein